MKRYFGVKHLYLLSSGKAALTIILRALAAQSPRRKVVIPAYTCFSVPSAIVRAGCQVVLCDLDPHTLDFDFANLQSIVDADTLCIVSPHLLGQASDIQQAKKIAAVFDVPVIEDAAQAMGRKTKDGWAGTNGDAGFFSLGRGKNITAGSGGIIVTNSDRLAETLTAVYAVVPEESLLSQLINALMVCAMTLLIRPLVYWLPAGLPFLGLGETVFHPDFPIHRLDGMRAGFLMAWQQRLEQSNEARTRHTEQYVSRFHQDETRLDPVRVPGAPYLRLPVIMPTAEKKREFCVAGKDQGLGVSALYPTPISKVPELKAMCGGQEYPGAAVLADRLVTLPVHQYVGPQDIERVCSVLHAVVGDASQSTSHRARRFESVSVSASAAND